MIARSNDSGKGGRCIRLIAALRGLPRSVDDMDAYFLLSPGIERQVAIAGDLRKNLRLLELDEAVLNEIVTRGYPSPTQFGVALPGRH